MIARCIEAITFQEAWRRYDDYEPISELILEALTSSFAHIHELPRFRTLELLFVATRYTSRGNSPCVQWTILSAISSQTPSPSLTSLTIDNLAPLYHPIYNSPSFSGLFRSLTSLSVTTAYDDVFSTHDHYRSFFVKFWEKAIQDRMLGSLSHSLTTLMLQGQVDVGVMPRLDFSQVKFPALEALSLQKILFNEETRIENFIVRHNGTLRRLWLAGCAIVVEDLDEVAARQWSHIWKHFAQEMKGLVSLVVRSDSLDRDGFTTDSFGEDDSLKYVGRNWQTWHSYEPWDERLPYEDGDHLALRELRRSVRLQALERQKYEE
ncbi:hypothetical protein HETIRDRAFT_409859 [Heterobasidion irregulare TC 32-1]|uniref:Uncharacterized protein n=1 Tax=Heterobasidion irregulare (strain TC 32-1) TaxID=747525 RepID=W4K3Q4_HETIT|nr:uncharacterized protein HETIRDRAFT_409859 [Heterobasidion irregulare TC 32-1]ETW80359.1 hypothetical protein HETIRDRAFT_409859 [Heterobasidion irregulare TC 32-1]